MAAAAGTAGAGGAENAKVDEIDGALEGIWALDDKESEARLRFKKGRFLTSVKGVPVMRGTYTTGAGKVTLNVTAYYVSFDGNPAWYAKGALREACIRFKAVPPQDVNKKLDRMFISIVDEYTVKETALVLKNDEKEAAYTKA